MNVGQILTLQAGKFPERTALVFEGSRFTYDEFNRRSNRFADYLLRSGLTKGDRVAALLFNSPPAVETFFGTAKAGGVFTPVNFRLAAEEVFYILDHSDARYFIFGEEFSPLVGKIRPRLPKVEYFICHGGSAPPDTAEYEIVLRASSPEEPGEAVAEDDECQMLYTSGTTGRPKGALLTHGNLLWNLVNTLLGREDQPGEASLICGPLYHAAPLNNHFLIRVTLGGTSILMKHFDARQAMEIIAREKVNVVSGAPALYHLLLNLPDVQNYDTRSVTRCTAGAAILPDETKLRLLKLFPNARGVYDVYGATEASPTIAVLKASDSLRKTACVGPAAQFVELKIVDDGDRELPCGAVGEIILRGPNIMKGYYKDPEATAEALRGGWLHTGDMGRLDEEGFLYIVDRKKDMIISGGENVYPREIEEVLYRHPKIQDAAVIGVPSSLWGEAVKAFVVLRPGEKMSGEEVVEYCREHLAGYKKPKFVAFVDSLPRNPSGKVIKTKLRADA
ncbi:MAG TPA: long-chain-fatty-acid--CoA ligase [Thermodesulfobacteriota bacterium]|nr:long-chain-fatty-acid--CoA ligase [Thermodesulfobacteriota bacterium]